jgi:hypothetical protein
LLTGAATTFVPHAQKLVFAALTGEIRSSCWHRNNRLLAGVR